MIGNLTIDKASMNLSYFLYSILLTSNNGGKISRSDFVREMANFCGLEATKNGKENRTPYNKSKLPRYFGFLDIDTTNDGVNYLVLTNRGKRILEIIDFNAEAEADEKYFIKSDKRENFIDLILESVVFDTFGKNNCGAEQSKTDVEPPKVLFKMLYDLKKSTSEEFCYVIFGLNAGWFKSYDEAIAKVMENRRLSKYDYTYELDILNASNIAHDCKLINIFTNSSINLLSSYKDETIGKVFYRLNPNLDSQKLDIIKNIKPINLPLRMYIYHNEDDKFINCWLNESIFGKVFNNDYIFTYKEQTGQLVGNVSNGIYRPGLLDEILLKCFENLKKNVYLLIESTSEESFKSSFGDAIDSLVTKKDLLDNYNGWSSVSFKNKDLYNYLVNNLNNAKDILSKDEVFLPSNLHIIGVIKMDNEVKINVDYEFTRSIVKESRNTIPNITNRTIGGYNKIYYGAPGCGKSYLVNSLLDDANVEKNNRIRVTFHPEYSNTDFIGQIVPTITEFVDADTGQKREKVSYNFNPGPFSIALKTAYNTGDMVYLIIEEINRGNAAAIFGDLFQLLDRVKDINKPTFSQSEYPINNPNIQKYLGLDESDYIIIPSNLTILATMNTSDQNVFTLDTAFKRRWSFEQISNDIVKDTTHEYKGWFIPGTNINWETFLTKLNDKILKFKVENSSSEDKRLGKYFVTKDCLTETAISDITTCSSQAYNFAYKVLEYIWNDVCKYGQSDWFDVEKYRTLEELIEGFMNEGLAIFPHINFNE